MDGWMDGWMDVYEGSQVLIRYTDSAYMSNRSTAKVKILPNESLFKLSIIILQLRKRSFYETLPKCSVL
jgi:hypothetical protein